MRPALPNYIVPLPPMPRHTYLHRRSEPEFARRGNENAQAVYYVVNPRATRLSAYDQAPDLVSVPHTTVHVDDAEADAPTRPVSHANIRTDVRADGEGEDVIGEDVEARSYLHHLSDNCPICQRMAAPVDDNLDLDFRPTLISRSSSGNGIMPAANHRAEYRVRVDGENEDFVAGDLNSRRDSERGEGVGDREPHTMHTLEEVLKNVDELLTGIKDLCEVQQRALRALQRLRLQFEVENVGEDERVEEPFRSHIYEAAMS